MAKIVKAITLWNGPYYLSNAYDWTAITDGSLWLYESSRYSDVSAIYFEASIASNNAYPVYIGLFDEYNNLVSGTSLSVSDTTATRVRSNDIQANLTNGRTYHVRVKSTDAYRFCYAYAARILIVQNGSITNTETQIEIGCCRGQTISSTSYTDIRRSGLWHYYASEWDGVSGVYLDISARIAHSSREIVACLWDVTANSEVSGSTIQYNSQTQARRISGDFSANLVDDHDYCVKAKSTESATTITFGHMRLVFRQQSPNKTVSYFTCPQYTETYSASWASAMAYPRYDANDWSCHSLTQRYAHTMARGNASSGSSRLIDTFTGTPLATLTCSSSSKTWQRSGTFTPSSPRDLDFGCKSDQAFYTVYYYGGHWTVAAVLSSNQASAAGELTSVGSLGKRANKSLAGVLAPAGELGASTGLTQSSDGGVGPTGDLAKRATRYLSASLGTSGSLAAVLARPSPPSEGRPRLLVEVSFETNAGETPRWVDISEYVQEVHTKRGRSNELEMIEAGTAHLILNNQTRRFDPGNPDGPYYGSLLPMRRIRISAIWRDTPYRLFTGFVEAWQQSWQGKLHICTVRAVDGFKILNLYECADMDVPEELSGKRVQRVLDATGMSGTFVDQGYWLLGDSVASRLGLTTKLASELVAYRLIDAGQSRVQDDTLDESALSHMQKVTESEGGTLFMDAEGRLVFQDRHYRIYSQGDPVATFGDAPDMTENNYCEMILDYDDSRLWNQIKLQARDGEEQIANDPNSQARYLKRTLSKTGLLLINDQEVLSRANALLALYKEPALRIERIIFEPTGMDELWEPLLAREISHRVSVIRRPASGQAIVRDYYIEAIEHDIGDDYWTASMQLSPAAIETYWILGDSNYSRLGVTTRLSA